MVHCALWGKLCLSSRPPWNGSVSHLIGVFPSSSFSVSLSAFVTWADPIWGASKIPRNFGQAGIRQIPEIGRGNISLFPLPSPGFNYEWATSMHRIYVHVCCPLSCSCISWVPHCVTEWGQINKNETVTTNRKQLSCSFDNLLAFRSWVSWAVV